MRRRLIATTLAVIPVAGIVAVVVIFARSPSHNGPAGDTTTVPHTVYISSPITGKLSYGMTERQVRARVGKPSRSVRDPTGLTCWQYDVDIHNARGTLDAVRVCFFSGRYSDAHYEFDGKWDYKPRKFRVTG